MKNTINGSPYRGSGQLTRQQFLFFETRATAKLMAQRIDDESIVELIVKDNIYQYPTEKTIRQVAVGCVARLNGLNDEELVSAIANQDVETAKQICLYAMMKQYRLVWDFMITVIGSKYRQQDFGFHRREVNSFLLQLQEQDDLVASWSESTVKKIGAVLMRLLIENEYIDNSNSNRLNPVLVSRILENNIRSNGEEIVLPAFNCLT